MFGLGVTEIFVILIVLIVVVKPENLPGVVKKVSGSYKDVKDTVKEVNKIKDDFVKLADADIEKLAKEQAGKALNPTSEPKT